MSAVLGRADDGPETPMALPRWDAGDGSALLDAADADFDALADRLHDGALQTLLVARYACDAVVRGADPVVARDAVQDALVALRRQVWLLRPRGAGDLTAALIDLSAQRTAAGLSALRLNIDSGVAAALVPSAAAAAYRLIQAVLTGAEPTSAAPDNPLSVRLTAVGDCAVLELDAVGADPASWALRARALGGDLMVNKAQTRLLLPLDRCDDEELL